MRYPRIIAIFEGLLAASALAGEPTEPPQYRFQVGHELVYKSHRKFDFMLDYDKKRKYDRGTSMNDNTWRICVVRTITTS